MQNPTTKPLVPSTLDLRTVIGILGMLLPGILSFGGWILFHTGLQDSISSYYYTGMRDVFVGALWGIGIMLLSYKGYECQDDLAGNVACLSAIGITLFPTTPTTNPTPNADWIGYAHFFFALVFFLALIYFSLFLFTKTDPNVPPTAGKLRRNQIYKVCGYTMALSILLIGVYFILPSPLGDFLETLDPIFFLETVAIEAFGFSWLAKGKDLQNKFRALQ